MNMRIQPSHVALCFCIFLLALISTIQAQNPTVC